MGCVISNVEYYLPIKEVTNNEITNLPSGWTSDKIEQKIGIKKRFIADDNETSLHLATNACEKLFSKGVDKNNIDALLLCTQSPEYFLPTTACLLQNKLGLRKNTFCLDYNLGCSGYIYGLAMAKSLIHANIAKNILLVTSETYSKYISSQDFSNQILFGDASAATLISYNDIDQLGEFIFGTDGEGGENLIVKNGASRFLNSKNQAHLYMNGPEIFSFANMVIPDLVTKTLNINKLHINEIDYFIFHQANKYMLEHLRKKIQIPEDKFLIDLENYGNTVSSTIPIVISNKLNIDKGFLNNKKIMLVGFGVGYSWGAVVIKN
jgi:3-oxoacyl-[acyl-carrier-protein] synthase-3